MGHRAVWAGLSVVMGAVLYAPMSADAVDLTGSYKMRIATGSPAIYCLGNFVQSGADLSMSGLCGLPGYPADPVSAIGTVDAGTGTFALIGQGLFTARRPER
jgi:hypothetical protein